MNADQIYEAIKARHSGPGWALLAEVPTATGVDRRVGRIDAYAIGMWADNRGFIAYEIKVTRGDFLRDLERFGRKQEETLKNSTQFYYAAPYKLISPDEVPEGCGLLEIQNGRAITTKAAAIRGLDSMDTRFVAALTRAALGTKEYESKHVWRYMDKDMSMEDVLDLAKREGHLLNQKRVEGRAKALSSGEGTQADQAIRYIGNALGVRGYGLSAEWWIKATKEKVDEVRDQLRSGRIDARIRDDVDYAFNALKRLRDRIDEINDKTKTGDSAT